MELQDALIHVNGSRVTVADVLLQLKVTGVFRDEVCRLVENQVILEKAKELGLEVSDAEFYDFAQAKRHHWGLTRAEEMNEYCRANGVTMEQWEEVTRSELLRAKIRSKVVEERAINDYFESHRDLMKTVSVSRIVCADSRKADEIKRAALEGNDSFSELARKNSKEESTRIAGGFLGSVKRGMLPKKADEAIFAAKVGDIAGPFVENGCCTLYKIDAIRDAELTDTMRREVADRIFSAWLHKAIDETSFERPK
ncbi:MAG: peptidylprolyl isomerase [Planctomycetes bacterium]|nr:peptidylprolyl isomerase [Planctomycetota bacterium]